MNPQAQQALKDALMRRMQGPSMNQGPTVPTLGQAGSPLATQAPPQGTPQPKFGSPFAGPKQSPGSQVDDNTKALSRNLIQKLLQFL